jgi:hypothetical protein
MEKLARHGMYSSVAPAPAKAIPQLSNKDEVEPGHFSA